MEQPITCVHANVNKQTGGNAGNLPSNARTNSHRTHLDYRPGSVAQRIHYSEQRRYLWAVACRTVDAAVPCDPSREHASGWSSWRWSRASGPCRSRGRPCRANGTDDLNWFVALFQIGEPKRSVSVIRDEKLNEQKQHISHCVYRPSSTKTTSTIAFNGMSTVCVHMQLAPQFGGRLSPLQNCSAGMSFIWDSIGDGGDT